MFLCSYVCIQWNGTLSGLGALSDTGVISGIGVLYETDTLSGAGALDDP